MSSYSLHKMGIPYYFSVIAKKHGGILSNSPVRGCDILLLDFNSVIHNAARRVLTADNGINGIKESAIFTEIWKYTEAIVQRANPVKEVHLMIDGVAPKAKMVQQRKRRFLNVLRNKLLSVAGCWDTNQISPGTPFMTRLGTFLKGKIATANVANGANVATLKHFISGADEAGEGEHKMFQLLAQYRDRHLKDENNVFIYGLDADLIMLSLLSEIPKITLMREQQQFGSAIETNVYLDIDTLAKGIMTNCGLSNGANGANGSNGIANYIVLCFLLGNDFLPNISALHLREGGIDHIMAAYRFVSANGALPLVDDKKRINMEIFGRILAELAKNEAAMMIDRNNEWLNRQPHIMPGATAETRRESEVHNWPLFREHRSPLANAIGANPAKWRSLYYKHLFNTSQQDGRVIRLSCEQWTRGILWTWAYYNRQPFDGDWYYPWGYSPTLGDLANYVQSECNSTSECNNTSETIVNTSECTKKSPFVTPAVQLLAILPPNSLALIPSVAKLATDARLGHLWPSEYRLETYLKTAFHECHPHLPALDFDLIERVV